MPDMQKTDDKVIMEKPIGILIAENNMLQDACKLAWFEITFISKNLGESSTTKTVLTALEKAKLDSETKLNSQLNIAINQVSALEKSRLESEIKLKTVLANLEKERNYLKEQLIYAGDNLKDTVAKFESDIAALNQAKGEVEQKLSAKTADSEKARINFNQRIFELTKAKDDAEAKLTLVEEEARIEVGAIRLVHGSDDVGIAIAVEVTRLGGGCSDPRSR